MQQYLCFDEKNYLEDRLHAVKIVGHEQNINISYESTSQEEKRKQSRLSLRGTPSSENDHDAHLDQTPPEKRARHDIRSSRKKNWERQRLARELKWNTRRKSMEKSSTLGGYVEL